MKDLGEKIWRLREAKGLSQEALAERLEVSRQTISNWENDRATPDAYKLRQLCEVLGVGADELLSMGEGLPASSERSPSPETADGQKRHKRRFWIALIAVLGTIAALLIAVAIVLFTLPTDGTQAITSAFTMTPTMGGIFLLVLSAALLAALTIAIFKRK